MMRRRQALVLTVMMLCDAYVHSGNAQFADDLLFIAPPPGKVPTRQSDIWRMKTDGSARHNLTRSTLPEIDPAFSPDERKVAFAVVWFDHPQSGIYTMNADGTGRRLVAASGESRNSPPSLLASPSWSPDSKRIAYSAFGSRRPGVPTSWIYIMNANGTHRRRLCEGLSPAWSPDGRRILYTAIKNGTPGQLTVVNVDGSGSKPLQKQGNRSIEGAGAWSPDGKRIAYVSGAESNFDLYVMNADGTHPVRLTQTPDHALGPRWSRDGKSLFFARLSPPHARSAPPRSAIFVTGATSRNTQRLSPANAVDLPSGTSLLLYFTFARSYRNAYEESVKKQ